MQRVRYWNFFARGARRVRTRTIMHKLHTAFFATRPTRVALWGLQSFRVNMSRCPFVYQHSDFFLNGRSTLILFARHFNMSFPFKWKFSFGMSFLPWHSTRENIIYVHFIFYFWECHCLVLSDLITLVMRRTVLTQALVILVSRMLTTGLLQHVEVLWKNQPIFRTLDKW